MGCQSRLVLLLLFGACALHVALASAVNSYHILHDKVSDRDLDSYEDDQPISRAPKISTPKVKERSSTSSAIKATNDKIPAATIAHKPISAEVLSDLIEASKYHSGLADHLKRSNILLQPAKKDDGSATAASSSSNKNKSEENYDLDDDDYSYDYYEDYNPDEGASTETTKKTKVGAINKPNLESLKAEDKRLPRTEQQASSEDDNNRLSNDTDNVDDGDDYDDEEDDDDDDEDDGNENDGIADEEEIVFSENVPCPRDCVCARNINGYLVATCSRLDLGKQKFGSDITDLVVTDVGPKYPIILGPDFFAKIGLKHVSTIKIANCTIEYLHHTAFNGLDSLYSVNLTNVGLASINPNTFMGNKGLRIMSITGNDLSAMSTVHYLLKSSSLEELDLSRNNLMELNPSAFSQIPNVVYINLSQNNLQKIPDKVFHNIKFLEELDLSYNSLKTLPVSAFNGTALAILRLNYNEITDDLRFGTADLQQLDLGFNSIKQIHHGMFDKMESLTNLVLKGNGLTKIQTDSFLTLKNLRNIDLSINKLEQVSSLLFLKNSELDVIRLNDNPHLSQLPTDGFQSYTGYFNVYFLDISNCEIGPLGHKTFSTMPQLATLKLAWNNINNLEPDTFVSLAKLNELDLSNNLIVKLDDSMFANNKDLTKLNLSGNPIRRLSANLFQPMNKLTHLDVSECELNSLLADSEGGQGAFYNTLRSFNASANHIKKISSADVKAFKNLRTLDISHNPIKCNEDFQDFINYMIGSTHTLSRRDPPLEAMKSDGGFVTFRSEEGWTELARIVCKHLAPAPPKDQSNTLDKISKYVDQDLDEEAKNLLDIGVNSKFKKIPNILQGSRRSDVEVDTNRLQSEGTMVGDVGVQQNIVDDEEEDSSDYDDEDDEDDDKEADDEYDSFDDKTVKVDLTNTENYGIKVKEIVVTEGSAEDKLWQNKFSLNGAESDDSSEDTEEIIIERGRIYYNSGRFLFPVVIIVTCALLIGLAVGKIVKVVMRKRGERYRMALLASCTNSIVYQKLSEEIPKPPEKEPKQPKIHRYFPINQV